MNVAQHTPMMQLHDIAMKMATEIAQPTQKPILKKSTFSAVLDAPLGSSSTSHLPIKMRDSAAQEINN
ncbi:MAG TPA: hypothetical protein VGQ19_12860 [Burkholderiales bacterium]|jgi:hypothetical protein|nr:hypothetical protein [Burkholderiales bacterium]